MKKDLNNFDYLSIPYKNEENTKNLIDKNNLESIFSSYDIE